MDASVMISLIGLARELVNSKAKLDEKYFDKFVTPIWEKFVEIHNDYKTSFREYAKFIFDENYNIDLLTEKIRQDSIYSNDLRFELGRMINAVPSAFPKTKQEYVNDFLLSLTSYFEIKQEFDIKRQDEKIAIYVPRLSNQPRYRVVIYLLRKRDKVDKEEVQKLLDETIQILQSGYDRVARCYYRLKNELLT